VFLSSACADYLEMAELPKVGRDNHREGGVSYFERGDVMD
jgi:hypothetical protein